jgi:hypothetical protein
MPTIIRIEDVKVRDHLEDIGVYGNLMLEWILGK